MSSFSIVTIDQIHKIVTPIVEPLLIPIGFKLQKRLHWLRSSDAPIRQIFCLRQWKGGQLAPAWGLSLDFVPHVSGNTIKWHRTEKTARLDLTFDTRSREFDIPYHHGPEPITQKAPHVLDSAIVQANVFWSNARTISELPGAFEKVKRHLSSGGLGFYNYTQHPIAYAFVLAMNDQPDAARAELDRWPLSPYLSEYVREKLAALLDAVCAT